MSDDHDGTVLTLSKAMTTTLTCVFGDGSTVEYDRDSLLSSCSFIKSMMEDRDELVVPLPLIPSKQRFLNVMKPSSVCSTNVEVAVCGANDSDYLGHQEALREYVKRLTWKIEWGQQSDIHLIVDGLVPQVLNAVIQRVKVSQFFANVERRNMRPITWQLQHIAEEVSRSKCSWSRFTFKGMARFDKLHLDKPTGDVPSKKYIANLIKEHDVEEVRALMKSRSVQIGMGEFIAEAACCFDCVDVLKLIRKMYPYREKCIEHAVVMDNDAILDYLVGDNVNLIIYARSMARVYCKEYQVARMNQKRRDLVVNKIV